MPSGLAACFSCHLTLLRAKFCDKRFPVGEKLIWIPHRGVQPWSRRQERRMGVIPSQTVVTPALTVALGDRGVMMHLTDPVG